MFLKFIFLRSYLSINPIVEIIQDANITVEDASTNNSKKTKENAIIDMAEKLKISPIDMKIKSDAYEIIRDMHKLKKEDLIKMDIHDKLINIESLGYQLVSNKRKQKSSLEDTIANEWTEIIMKTWKKFSDDYLTPLILNLNCTIAFCMVGADLFLDIAKRDCKIQELSENKFDSPLEEKYVEALILMQQGYKALLEDQLNAIHTKDEQEIFYDAWLSQQQSIPTYSYYRTLRLHQILMKENETKEDTTKENGTKEDGTKEELEDKEYKSKSKNEYFGINKLNVSPQLLIKLAHMNSLDISKTTIGLATFGRLINVYNMKNLQLKNGQKIDPNAFKHQYSINKKYTADETFERRLREGMHDLNQNKILFDIVHDKVPFHYKDTFPDEETQSLHEEYMINKKTYPNKYNYNSNEKKTMFDYILTKVFMKEEKNTPRGREYIGKGHLPPVKKNMTRYEVNKNTYVDSSKPSKEMKDEAKREFNYNEYDRVGVSQEGKNTVIDMIGKYKDPDNIVENATQLNFELKKKLADLSKLRSESSVVKQLRHIYNKDKNHGWLRKQITDSDLYWKFKKHTIMADYLKNETINDSVALKDIRKQMGTPSGGQTNPGFNMYARQKILNDIQGIEKSRLISSMVVGAATIGVFAALATDIKDNFEDIHENVSDQSKKAINDILNSEEVQRIKESFAKGDTQFDEKYNEWKTWKTWDAVNWWQFEYDIRKFGWDTVQFKDEPSNFNNVKDTTIII